MLHRIPCVNVWLRVLKIGLIREKFIRWQLEDTFDLKWRRFGAGSAVIDRCYKTTGCLADAIELEFD